jgi:hypothetical protein
MKQFPASLHELAVFHPLAHAYLSIKLTVPWRNVSGVLVTDI